MLSSSSSSCPRRDLYLTCVLGKPKRDARLRDKDSHATFRNRKSPPQAGWTCTPEEEAATPEYFGPSLLKIQDTVLPLRFYSTGFTKVSISEKPSNYHLQLSMGWLTFSLILAD